MYDNGDTDYSLGFDFVVSPAGARLAAVYDDFVVEKSLVLTGFQVLIAVDFGKTVCKQYSPSFQVYQDAPNGTPTTVHGPFAYKVESVSSTEHQHLGELYFLTVRFAKTTFHHGHYWFKFSSYCMEQQNGAFVLATSTVKNDEGWITTPEFTGPISSSPYIVPPHDFAFALISGEK
jgi:hypothetical protein